MLVGAHVSVAGGVDNAVERERAVGGNCGQIFTTSPRVWAMPEIDPEEATRFREETAAMMEGPWVIHSSYLVNLATPKADLRDRSIESLQAELDAAAELSVPYVCVHLGAHTGAGVEQGLTNVAESVDELDHREDVTLVIENDAGSGTKLGDTFDQLATVLDTSQADVGVCLDTAHMFAAGYDISSLTGVDDVLAEFDAIVGRDHLACIHLNDSRHACGTNKDEHAHLGEGYIGKEGIKAMINHELIRDLPYILETPEDDGKDFAWNVSRAKTFREQA